MFHNDPTDRQSHHKERHGPNPGDTVFLRQITKTGGLHRPQAGVGIVAGEHLEALSLAVNLTIASNLEMRFQ